MARFQQFDCKSCGSIGSVKIVNPAKLDLAHCEYCKSLGVYDPEDLRITTKQEALDAFRGLMDDQVRLPSEAQRFRAPQLYANNPVPLDIRPSIYAEPLHDLERCWKCSAPLTLKNRAAPFRAEGQTVNPKCLCIPCLNAMSAGEVIDLFNIEKRVTVTHTSVSPSSPISPASLIVWSIGLALVGAFCMAASAAFGSFAATLAGIALLVTSIIVASQVK